MKVRITSKLTTTKDGWSTITFKCPRCKTECHVEGKFDESGVATQMRVVDKECKGCDLVLTVQNNDERRNDTVSGLSRNW